MLEEQDKIIFYTDESENSSKVHPGITWGHSITGLQHCLTQVKLKALGCALGHWGATLSNQDGT